MSLISTLSVFFFVSILSLQVGCTRTTAFPYLKSRTNNVINTLDRDHSYKKDPSLLIAARAPLFKYATKEALKLLNFQVKNIKFKDVKRGFNIPIVGDFEVSLNNISVESFQVPSDDNRLDILDGFFDLDIKDISLTLSFKWGWKKASLKGSGLGTLLLQNGTFNYIYDISMDEQIKKPQLSVVTGSTHFEGIALKLVSFHGEWLYNAILTIFNGVINNQIQKNIEYFLGKSVPQQVNDALLGLPTSVKISGLPFSTSFDYSFYTSEYVLINAFEKIAVDPANDGSFTPRVCPYHASAFPFDGARIANETHMLSIYVHENEINCALWALFTSNRFNASISGDSVSFMPITTDLLGSLIQELPVAYPGKSVRFEVTAVDVPHIAFEQPQVAAVAARYILSLYVIDGSPGDVKIFTMLGNLSASAALDWQSTEILDVAVKHTVEMASLDVAPEPWDEALTWVLQNYGGLYTLQQLWSTYVHSPMVSHVRLERAKVAIFDQWFEISSDVLYIPPSPSLHVSPAPPSVLSLSGGPSLPPSALPPST